VGQVPFEFNATGDEFNAEALTSDLNPEQRAAVLANDGPVLMLAGAGSGKTRALTRKIATLVMVEGYRPWEILAVTFTNKAAGEMRERCAELLGDRAKDLWLGTFHSIGVRVLRRHGTLIGIPRGFVIYDSTDQQTMVTRCARELNIDDKQFTARQFQHYINAQKQVCRGPDADDLPMDGRLEALAATVYQLYGKRMLEAGAVDFSDLIYLPWRLFTEHPAIAFEYQNRWRYILVDEFQDTNAAQYNVLKAVLNPERRLCVVGDDDQSIYGWRGAEVENILNFDRDFPGAQVYRLEQNYRSSQNILEVSGALIAQNRDRHGKTLWTEQSDGEPVLTYQAQSDADEARYVVKRVRALRDTYNLGEMAIFYRTNAQSRTLEERLRSANIPYRIIGGLKFYERLEIKDMLAYLKLMANPRDTISFERIINRPKRGIGDTTVQRLRQRAIGEDTTMWVALEREIAGGTPGIKKKLTPFLELMQELRHIAETETALAAIAAVIDRTGYIKTLKDDGTIESDNRAENVGALFDGIDEYCERSEDKSLAAYLDEVSLTTDLDQSTTNDDMVVMMTAHTAKGLEYDVVFVTGLEEGLMPHANSSETASGLEEERRLAYVAMTRARKLLHLTWAVSRRRFGQTKAATPSRFLTGLPKDRLKDDGSYKAPAPMPSFGGASGGWQRNSWQTQSAGGAGGGGGGGGEAKKDIWASTSSFIQDAPSYEDFSQDYDDNVLRPGRKVFSSAFGEGVVIQVIGQGDRAKAQVQFNSGQTKKILARVLSLV
jgi:DNA helicase-2/ATP-dependent DNA helicase PcrA